MSSEQQVVADSNNKLPVRVLIVDNYDSYTYNLLQLFGSLTEFEATVMKNDAITYEALRPQIALDSASRKYDCILISPGPGVATNELDVGVALPIVEQCDDHQLPIYGVCLGHQLIAHRFGAALYQLAEVSHGVVSDIQILDPADPIFAGIPSPFRAVRYHSWSVALPLPSCLVPLAVTSDDNGQTQVLMAFRHAQRDHLWAVQFHPESICSTFGTQIAFNFLNFTIQYLRARNIDASVLETPPLPPVSLTGTTPLPSAPSESCRYRKFSVGELSKEALFCSLFHQEFVSSTFGAKHIFWLDSSEKDPSGRYSFMGICRRATAFYNSSKRGSERDAINFLRRECQAAPQSQSDGGLPTALASGFVGYLGYDAAAPWAAEGRNPDAAFMRVENYLAYDAYLGEIYAVCSDPSAFESALDSWEKRVVTLVKSAYRGDFYPIRSYHPEEKRFGFSLQITEDRYLDAIAKCKELINRGESYELCLTNKVHCEKLKLAPQTSFETLLSWLSMYIHLRRENPAPKSAFMVFNTKDGFLNDNTFSILSASPETFLNVDSLTRSAVSKPIKGTRPRGETELADCALRDDLATNAKDFAENLMICDLVRNDLGRVCEIGSVSVDPLMQVESYPSMHQLVSTVKGTLKLGTSGVDAIEACFPPGSMTGAPKVRSVELLRDLETISSEKSTLFDRARREIYSGVLGWVSRSGGCDLAVIIRTIVADRFGSYVGCGGAIVAKSDPKAEWVEMILKTKVSLRAMILSRDPVKIFHPIKIGGIRDLTYVGPRLPPPERFNFSQPRKPDFASEYLHSLGPKGMIFGTSRMTAVLSAMGDPHLGLQVAHVTGTNGKGSVCAMLSSILTFAGINTGLFLSPHLVEWTESVRINDVDIGYDELSEACRVVESTTRTIGIELSQFEALAAASFWIFKERNVEIALVEVGLGGRDDATNVFSTNLCSIVTSIGFDHMNVLGNTLEDITWAKVGIIKPDRPCIFPASVPAAARQVIENTCYRLHAQPRPTFPTSRYSAYFQGEHQNCNFGLVLAALDVIASSDAIENPVIRESLHNNHTVLRGLMRTRWTARIEWWEWNGKRVLLDGAHNPDAATALRRWVLKNIRPTPVTWIIGMVSSKNIITFVEALHIDPKCDRIILVPFKPNVGWQQCKSAEEMAFELVRSSNGPMGTGTLDLPCDIQTVHSVERALDTATLTLMHMQVIVTGSLHLCGNVMASCNRGRNRVWPEEPFSLLETIGYCKGTFRHLDQHMARLHLAAEFFGFSEPTPAAILPRLDDAVKEAQLAEARMRLLWNYRGVICIECLPMTRLPSPMRILIAPDEERLKVFSGDPFVRFKTSYRTIFDDSLKVAYDCGCNDAILYNERGEATEACLYNFAIKKAVEGPWLTPPITCGLMAGLEREHLLRTRPNEFKEQVLSIKELLGAVAICVFNSVRGLILNCSLVTKDGRVIIPEAA